MGLWANILREIRFIRISKKMLAAVKSIEADSPNLLTDDIEKSVDKFSGNLAFMEDDKSWTYAEFEAYANRVAHWALAQGCTAGDTVSIFVRNRLEYVALWFGLSKVGVIPALINYQLRAKALVHCVHISNSKLAIVDSELTEAWGSAKIDIPVFSAFGAAKGFDNFDEALTAQSDERPARSHRAHITAKDILMKMFTSGTTGMPKAAKVSHTRGQYYMRGFIVAADSKPTDRVMMVLPLYHATGGMCGVGMALMRGGAVIVRAKFSVSTFWDEAEEHGATLFMYVGELCRFLLGAPEHPKERAHKLRCIVGNGLRPEVWEDFTARFNIPCVVEFYGATEGNISMINVNGPPGAVGRIPEYMRSKLNGDLIRYDVKAGTHIKGADGLYQRTEPGEIGELIGEIREGETRFRYDGYENKEASQKKVLRNVLKKGDAWFRTGDLLWRDELGYYFFSDRMGDTYRWKAENVSTGEVAAALTAFDGVHQANVYGVAVPGYDGKAGMASMVADKGLDLSALRKHVHDALPPYARPLFLRISSETETTSTFKYKKTNLVKAGFDPALVKDALYFDDPETGTYKKLSQPIFKKIQNEKLKF